MQFYLRFPEFKTKALTFSYDDGRDYDRRLVELFNKYGLKGTFNLNSGMLGNDGYIGSDEVKTLYVGHEVAAHTMTHPKLECLNTAEMASEILQDRKNLEALCGKIVTGMAYPFGLSDTKGEPEVMEMCGIQYGRTTISTYKFPFPKDFLRWHPTCHQSDERIDELIEKFKAPDDPCGDWRVTPKLFYIWGHSYEFANNKERFSWEYMEDICKKLAFDDGVWYATNGEIQRYIEAFNSLIKSCDGKTVYNPTSTVIYAWANKKLVTIKAGTTVTL